MNKTFKTGMMAVGGTALAASSSYALTSTFTISVAFLQPFTITEATAMDFGTLVSDTASTYTLSTGDAITATGAGQSVGGTPKSGDYTIADTGTSTGNIDISVVNLTAANGVTPVNPVCNYAAGGDVAGCALVNAGNPGAGATLTIGIQLQVDGTQTTGTTASPTFDITVAYN